MSANEVDVKDMAWPDPEAQAALARAIGAELASGNLTLQEFDAFKQSLQHFGQYGEVRFLLGGLLELRKFTLPDSKNADMIRTLVEKVMTAKIHQLIHLPMHLEKAVALAQQSITLADFRLALLAAVRSPDVAKPRPLRLVSVAVRLEPENETGQLERIKARLRDQTGVVGQPDARRALDGSWHIFGKIPEDQIDFLSVNLKAIAEVLTYSVIDAQGNWTEDRVVKR